ncbi:hypothetical protein [Alicyclobacillus acidocaldarius]|uniref:Uncharacterized protein n=1 Tax=Alicyclobacillus acidocaldarius (strain Tc-4-1) TaxID=1048834 RepID=F8IH51_ALIAT|nr:hypothetical protein [Alicyclobacillus acidocaldarius]AEJ44405.1 hypothetical protein TC41_2507 [Alicyclobacillus acidocaldarius subsp. acidocaldarius Tc-4-1]
MTYDQWKLMTPEEDAALWGLGEDENEWFDEDEMLKCECCGDVLDEDTAIQDGPSWFCSECWEENTEESEVDAQKENA